MVRIPLEANIAPLGSSPKLRRGESATPIAQKTGQTYAADQQTDRGCIGLEAAKRNQEGGCRRRGVDGPKRQLCGNRQSHSESARSQARRHDVSGRHGRRGMQRAEQRKRQESCDRSDPMSCKCVPGSRSFLLGRDSVDEDRRPEAREEERLLKDPPKPADDSDDNEGYASSVQRGPQ